MTTPKNPREDLEREIRTVLLDPFGFGTPLGRSRSIMRILDAADTYAARCSENALAAKPKPDLQITIGGPDCLIDVLVATLRKHINIETLK